MVHGPLEYVVIGFDGHHFTDDIWPELRAIQARDIVRLVDLVFVKKGANGALTIEEVKDLGADETREYESVAPKIQGLMTMEDIAEVTADLPAQSSAAIALFEHTWAITLMGAILRANGRLLHAGMIQPDTLEVVDQELAEAAP